MNLWWYKWDFDLIEEGLQAEQQDSRTESSRANAYKEHVEKIHEYLCETIGQKYRHLFSNDSNHGKSTVGSSGFGASTSNGMNSKCKHWEVSI